MGRENCAALKAAALRLNLEAFFDPSTNAAGQSRYRVLELYLRPVELNPRFAMVNLSLCAWTNISAPKRSQAKPGDRSLRCSPITTHESPVSSAATRDTERVEMRTSHRKQSTGHAPTRDRSRPLIFRQPLPMTMSLTYRGPRRAPRVGVLKGGTRYQPLTRVSHRKNSHIQMQGRNVPVHFVSPFFACWASSNFMDRDTSSQNPDWPIAVFRARCARAANQVAYGHSVEESLP